jgi:hypothetical protein
MDLQLNIDGSKINEYMAAKILESTLGDQIKKQIAETMKTFDAYNSPLKGVVNQFVNQVIDEELRTTYKAPVQEAIRKAMTTEQLEKLADEYVSKLAFNTRGY